MFCRLVQPLGTALVGDKVALSLGLRQISLHYRWLVKPGSVASLGRLSVDLVVSGECAVVPSRRSAHRPKRLVRLLLPW